jgi:hypothetical protein
MGCFGVDNRCSFELQLLFSGFDSGANWNFTGAKAHVDFATSAARLKSCPRKKQEWKFNET